MGGIGVTELLLVLVIVLVFFGGNRLRTLGSDLGTAIRGFRDAMKEDSKPAERPTGQALQSAAAQTPDAPSSGEPASAHLDLLSKNRQA